jgi:hypothetical protein
VRHQRIEADVLFSRNLATIFHDPWVTTRFSFPDSSLNVIFQDSAVSALSSVEKAAMGQRVMAFVRQNYPSLSSIHRVRVLFASTRFVYPTDSVVARVPATGLSIDHLEAHLIFQDGSVSSYDVMDSPTYHPALWNTIIGEGIATDRSGTHHASTSTLVVVAVSGPSSGYAPGLMATLEVSGPGRAAETLSDTVPHLDSLGRTRISFRIPDTGCDTLRLSARLNTDTVAVHHGLVLFECGE